MRFRCSELPARSASEEGRFLAGASGWCAILIAWSALALPLRAQDQEVRTISFEGPEVFCHILNEIGLKPITSLQEKIDPKRTLIVIFGQTRKINEIQEQIGELHRYVEFGGSLLVATDYPLNVTLPIQISGERFAGSKEFGYRDRAECPFVI